MKFMGLIVFVVVAVLLPPSLAAPTPTFDPVTSVLFTAAGGLVLNTASGAITVPTIALLGAKAVALKGLFIASELARRNGDS